MTARDYAVLTLDEKRLPGMPREAFKRRSAVPPADSRDRALAEQLVIGVVKNHLHLIRLIELFAERRGFVEEMRSWESRLEVATFDPAPFAGGA